MNKSKGITVFLALALLNGCSEENASQLDAWLADPSDIAARDYGEPVTDFTVLKSEDIGHTARSRKVVWITADVDTIDSAIATSVSVALQQSQGYQAISVDFFSLKSNGRRSLMPLVTVEYSPDGNGFHGFDESGDVIVKVTAARNLPTQGEIDVDLMPSHHDIHIE